MVDTGPTIIFHSHTSMMTGKYTVHVLKTINLIAFYPNGRTKNTDIKLALEAFAQFLLKRAKSYNENKGKDKYKVDSIEKHLNAAENEKWKMNAFRRSSTFHTHTKAVQIECSNLKRLTSFAYLEYLFSTYHRMFGPIVKNGIGMLCHFNVNNM